MTSVFLYDRAGMVTTTTGTAALTLGGAVGATAPNLCTYQSFAAAGVTDQQTVPYLILDANGSWEYGRGVYSASGTTLTRNVLASSSSGAPLNLSGNAQVFITPLAEDLLSMQRGGDLNLFRNAAFDVAQRGTSGSVPSGSTAYTVDGWMISATGVAANWSQQYSVTLAGSSLRIACASGLTNCTLQHRIESFTAARALAFNKAPQPVTVQFAISNNTANPITAAFESGVPNARDVFTTVNTDLNATPAQTIAAGATGIVSYTFVPSATMVNGYQVQLQLGGALNAASGSIDIGRAELRSTPNLAVGLNNYPPPPELRDITRETLACQRFLEVLTSISTTTSVAQTFSYTCPFLTQSACWTFHVAKRSLPAFALFPGVAWVGSVPTVFLSLDSILFQTTSDFSLNAPASSTLACVASSEL